MDVRDGAEAWRECSGDDSGTAGPSVSQILAEIQILAPGKLRELARVANPL